MPSIISVTPFPAVESVGSGFGGVLEYRVDLSEASADAVSVSYRAFPGSAFPERDLPPIGDTLTFAPGVVTQTVSFRATSDNIDETDEAFVLEFFNPEGGSFAGGRQTLRVTNFIEDDDGSNVDRALFVSSPRIVEGVSGAASVVFDVSVSEAFATTTRFDYRTEDGTATAGSDYTAQSGQVTFAPGVRSVQVSVPVLGDTLSEPSEHFRLIVDTDGSIADGGITSVGEATVLDDDSGGARPTMTLSIDNANESIGSGFGGTFLATLRLSEASNDAVTVNYRVLGDTAQSEVDFPATAGQVTFSPGETVKVVTFRATSDNLIEPDESLMMELFNPTGAAFAGGAPVLRDTAFILDDDGVGLKRALHVSSPVVVEGDDGVTRAVFDIRISRPSTETLTFDYATQDAGAQAGSDYTAVSGSLSFAPGQTRASVEVDVTGDTAAELTEAFQLVVTPTGALGDGGAGAVGEATVLDDDTGGALPTFSLVPGAFAPDAAAESIGSGFGGTFTFTAMLSEASNDAVSVTYRTIPLTTESEIDFPRTTGTLTFAPGETLKTVSFRTSADNIDEDDEAFALEFVDITGAAFAGGGPVLRDIGFVLDDDGVGLNRSLQVSSPVILEGDAGSGIARFELNLSRPSDTALTFSYGTRDGSAQAGSDYVARSGTVTFQPGQTFAVVDVTVNGDTLSEVSEFFQLAVTPTSALGDGGKGTVGQATLLDDDGAGGLPTVSVSSANARESRGSGFGATVDFVVTLSAPSVDSVTVDYRGVDGTAIGGTDYPDFAGTLTFAPGETSKAVSVAASHDNIEESDESFAIELFDPTGAVLAGGVDTLQEAAFLLDDDGVGLKRAVHVSSVTIDEPASGTATATVIVTLSRPFDVQTDLSYETVDGSATAGADYIAQSGTLSFAPGQTEAAVIVPVRADGLSNEETETFLVSLNAPPATLTGAPEGRVGTVTILQPEAAQAPPTGSVAIAGARSVGATLTADTSAISDPNGLGPFSLQWLRDGVEIGGATGTSYVLGQTDLYAAISVRVSYVDGGGTAESVIGQAGEIGLAASTSGNDTITGGDEDDQISGGPGNDSLDGGGGDDTIAGADGIDTIRGSEGNDLIGGGTGDDLIFGGGGNDTIGAGQGNDTADGGDGNDIVNGGAGDDSLSGGSGNDTMGASLGNDTVLGGDGNDDIGGGAGRDLLDGGNGNDSIGGGEGDDTVNGGAGNDFLAGGGRNDLITGGAGNDTINGGDGDDTMTGGDGADVFVFNFFKNVDADVITDFDDGTDSFLIRIVNTETGQPNIDNGGNGLRGYLDALNITDTAGGAMLNIDGHTVLVQNVAAADLTLADFEFI